jgi:hypothetical protein
MKTCSVQSALLRALEEVTDYTAAVYYNPDEDKYELTWQDKIFYLSKDKATRYVEEDTILDLLRSLRDRACNKHSIMPEEVLFNRRDIVEYLERELVNIVRAAGLPETSGRVPAELIQCHRRVILDALSKRNSPVHEEETE